MNNKKKQKNANLVMVLIIALILLAGVGAAGFILGWFGGSGSSAKLTGVKGIVNLTRNSVTYPVEETTELRKGDVIECAPGGSASITVMQGSAVAIAEQAKMTVTEPGQKAFAADIENGEVFAIVGKDAKPVTLRFGENSAEVQNAVVSVSVHSDAQILNVFSGEVNGIARGNTVSWVQGEKEENELIPEALNSFAIKQLRAVSEEYDPCFTVADLDALEERRKQEQKELGEANAVEALQELDYDHECTVTIVCDTILDHMDQFDPAKMEFLPDDGVIMDTVKVPFAEGETAYDVTKRACDAMGIPIEASWTPLYDAYYIEGINNIYEFDCGPESGWMYKVNGWFPNYGCSAYNVQEGDNVYWCYTCVGLGTDVGGVGY